MQLSAQVAHQALASKARAYTCFACCIQYAVGTIVRHGAIPLGNWHGLNDGIQCRCKMLDRPVDVMQLVQAEKAYAKCLEVVALVALQGYASRRLHSGFDEFLTGVQPWVIGVAYDDPGCFVAGRCDALEASFLQQGSHLVAQLLLFGANFLEAIVFGFLHHIAQHRKTVGRHGGVVGEAACLVGLHDLQPFAQIAGEAGADRGIYLLSALGTQHDQAATSRAAPALLRSSDQHVNTNGLHIDPDGAGCDAIQYKQATVGMHGIGDLPHIVVGQHNAGCRFHVCGEHDVRLACFNLGHDFVYGRWSEWRLAACLYRSGLQHCGAGGDAAHLENLCPPIAEPSGSDHQAFFVGGKLPRDGFHAEGPAAGYNDGRLCAVYVLQGAGDISHDALEILRHMVDGTIGVDHRVFGQPVRVDVG